MTETTSLAQRESEALGLSPERLDILRKTVANGLTVPEFELFREYVVHSKLDPFRRQIYALKIEGKLSVHVGIDGLRVVANRTGEFEGVEGPWWCGPDGKWVDVWLEEGPPAAARVIVHRTGRRPVAGTVKYTSFVQLKDGKPNRMWNRMPDHMLAKCAEALAIRRAFPDETSGMAVSIDDDGEVRTRPRIVNPDAPATDYQKGKLIELARDLEWEEEDRHLWLQERFGVASSRQLTKAQASEGIDDLLEMLADREAGIQDAELVEDEGAADEAGKVVGAAAGRSGPKGPSSQRNGPAAPRSSDGEEAPDTQTEPPSEPDEPAPSDPVPAGETGDFGEGSPAPSSEPTPDEEPADTPSPPAPVRDLDTQRRRAKILFGSANKVLLFARDEKRGLGIERRHFDELTAEDLEAILQRHAEEKARQ